MHLVSGGEEQTRVIEMFHQRSQAARARLEEAGQAFLLKKELKTANVQIAEIKKENEALAARVKELRAKSALTNAANGVVVQADIPVARPYAVFRKYPSAEDVLLVVANFYNITAALIKSPRRAANVVGPRMVVSYLCCELTGLSLDQIGRALGKHHTTILYGRYTIEKSLSLDERLKDEIDLLKIKIAEVLQARNAEAAQNRKQNDIAFGNIKTFTLPFPPSVNDMLFNMPGHGRPKTTAYRAWLKEAGQALDAQKPTAVAGRVNVDIDLDDRRQGDADNRAKPILDLLSAHGVFPNDSKKYVRRVSIGWESLSGCQVKIIPA